MNYARCICLHDRFSNEKENTTRTKRHNPSGPAWMEELGEEKVWLRIIMQIMKEERVWSSYPHHLQSSVCVCVYIYPTLTWRNLYLFIWFILCVSTSCLTQEAPDHVSFVPSWTLETRTVPGPGWDQWCMLDVCCWMKGRCGRKESGCCLGSFVYPQTLQRRTRIHAEDEVTDLGKQASQCVSFPATLS